MGPEVLIMIVAAFVSGGAIGAAGTLLAQWVFKSVGPDPASLHRGIDPAERNVLREEVAELHKHLRNMDARLDFTERLLDGALPLAPPPARMPAPELDESVRDRARDDHGQGVPDEEPHDGGHEAPS